LIEYNKSHKDYILIFPSSFTTSSRSSRIKERFDIDMFSKASCIFEVNDIRHSACPLAHFNGRVNAMDICYAQVPLDSFYKSELSRLSE
jgi:hypothetical protein